MSRNKFTSYTLYIVEDAIQNLALSDVRQLVLAFLTDPVAHFMLQSEQLDHADDVRNCFRV